MTSTLTREIRHAIWQQQKDMPCASSSWHREVRQHDVNLDAHRIRLNSGCNPKTKNAEGNQPKAVAKDNGHKEATKEAKKAPVMLSE